MTANTSHAENAGNVDADPKAAQQERLRQEMLSEVMGIIGPHAHQFWKLRAFGIVVASTPETIEAIRLRGEAGDPVAQMLAANLRTCINNRVLTPHEMEAMRQPPGPVKGNVRRLIESLKRLLWPVSRPK